jgi:hypothetical protein
VSVAKGDRLRVYVYPDQSSAAFVRDGDAAVIRIKERPGWTREAHVTRTSGTLSPRTRTMQTEVDIENADRAILPGSYVDVELSIQVPPLVEIPAEALVVRGDKAQVALIDGGGRVRFKPVVVADDDGQTVRLVRGLDDGARVAVNLGGDAEEGSPVQVVETKPAPAKP